jgi:hypothetical protein
MGVTFCKVAAPGAKGRHSSRSELAKHWGDSGGTPAETFLYTCGAIDLWEWEFRLLDQVAGVDGDDALLCLGGRGAAPPEDCGGPSARPAREPRAFH